MHKEVGQSFAKNHILAGIANVAPFCIHLERYIHNGKEPSADYPVGVPDVFLFWNPICEPQVSVLYTVTRNFNIVNTERRDVCRHP